VIVEIRTLTGCGSAPGAGRKRGVGVEFEACIKLSSATIRFDLGVLLAIDFNGDEVLCIFSWVHNG
jgi:hypothetical protein